MGAYLRELAPNSSTDSAFRAWGSQLSNDLASFGLSTTRDSGQLTWNTITAPTSTFVYQGYEIWQFADSLQNVAPVYFRIDYGSGSGTNNVCPRIAVTVGTGTNRHGVILGAAPVATLCTGTGGTNLQACVFSGSTNRVTIALFVDLDTSANFFSIERTKDAAGNDTPDGILFTVHGNTNGDDSYYNNGTYRLTQYIPFAGNIPPSGASYIIMPSQGNSGVVGNDICLYPNYLFNNSFILNPGINTLGYYFGDVLSGSTGQASFYNTMHTYYFLGNKRFIANVSRYSYANTCLAMLFE